MDFVSEWQKFVSDDNLAYWYNKESDESVWEDPLLVQNLMITNQINKKPIYWETFEDTKWIKINLENNEFIYVNVQTKKLSNEVPKPLQEIVPQMIQKPVQVPKIMLPKLNPQQIKPLQMMEQQMHFQNPHQQMPMPPQYPPQQMYMSSKQLLMPTQKMQISSMQPLQIPMPPQYPPQNLQEPADYYKQYAQKLMEQQIPQKSQQQIDDEKKQLEEHQIQEFKQFLKELDLKPYSKWEKELPKLIHDKRYIDLTAHLRKSIFDQHIKNFFKDKPKERNERRKKAEEAVVILIKEFIKQGGFEQKDTSYKRFQKTFEDDDRFIFIQDQEKEKLLTAEEIYNESLSLYNIEQKRIKDELKKDFVILLGKKIDLSKLDKKTQFRDVKKNLHSHDIYDKINLEDKELYFEEFKLKQLQKLRERDQWAQEERQKQRDHMRNHNKRLFAIKQKEATEMFNVLLSEKIKNRQTSFKDAMNILEEDIKNDETLLQYLEMDQMRELYQEFTRGKFQEIKKSFAAFLDSFQSDLISQDLNNLIEMYNKHTRLGNIPEDEAKELLTEKMRAIRKKVIQDYEEFLDRTHLVTKDSFNDTETYEMCLLKLQEDIRYRRMDSMQELRQKLTQNKIENLKQAYEIKRQAKEQFQSLIEE